MEAVPDTSKSEVTEAWPITSNLVVGFVVPIPTFPLFSTNKVFEIDAPPPETEKVTILELAILTG